MKYFSLFQMFLELSSPPVEMLLQNDYRPILQLISQLTCLYFLITLAGEAIERNYFDKNQQVVQEEEGEEEGSTEVKATKVAEVWPQRQPPTVC